MKRFIPKSIRALDRKTRTNPHAMVWRVYDTKTKKWWYDPNNQPTTWYDASLASDLLNSTEK